MASPIYSGLTPRTSYGSPRVVNNNNYDVGRESVNKNDGTAKQKPFFCRIGQGVCGSCIDSDQDVDDSTVAGSTGESNRNPSSSSSSYANLSYNGSIPGSTSTTSTMGTTGNPTVVIDANSNTTVKSVQNKSVGHYYNDEYVNQVLGITSQEVSNLKEMDSSAISTGDPFRDSIVISNLRTSYNVREQRESMGRSTIMESTTLDCIGGVAEEGPRKERSPSVQECYQNTPQPVPSILPFTLVYVNSKTGKEEEIINGQIEEIRKKWLAYFNQRRENRLIYEPPPSLGIRDEGRNPAYEITTDATTPMNFYDLIRFQITPVLGIPMMCLEIVDSTNGNFIPLSTSLQESSLKDKKITIKSNNGCFTKVHKDLVNQLQGNPSDTQDLSLKWKDHFELTGDLAFHQMLCLNIYDGKFREEEYTSLPKTGDKKDNLALLLDFIFPRFGDSLSDPTIDIISDIYDSTVSYVANQLETLLLTEYKRIGTKNKFGVVMKPGWHMQKVSQDGRRARMLSLSDLLFNEVRKCHFLGAEVCFRACVKHNNNIINPDIQNNKDIKDSLMGIRMLGWDMKHLESAKEERTLLHTALGSFQTIKTILKWKNDLSILLFKSEKLDMMNQFKSQVTGTDGSVKPAAMIEKLAIDMRPLCINKKAGHGMFDGQTALDQLICSRDIFSYPQLFLQVRLLLEDPDLELDSHHLSLYAQKLQEGVIGLHHLGEVRMEKLVRTKIKDKILKMIRGMIAEDVGASYKDFELPFTLIHNPGKNKKSSNYEIEEPSTTIDLESARIGWSNYVKKRKSQMQYLTYSKPPMVLDFSEYRTKTPNRVYDIPEDPCNPRTIFDLARFLVSPSLGVPVICLEFFLNDTNERVHLDYSISDNILRGKTIRVEINTIIFERSFMEMKEYYNKVRSTSTTSRGSIYSKKLDGVIEEELEIVKQLEKNDNVLIINNFLLNRVHLQDIYHTPLVWKQEFERTGDLGVHYMLGLNLFDVKVKREFFTGDAKVENIQKAMDEYMKMTGKTSATMHLADDANDILNKMYNTSVDFIAKRIPLLLAGEYKRNRNLTGGCYGGTIKSSSAFLPGFSVDDQGKRCLTNQELCFLEAKKCHWLGVECCLRVAKLHEKTKDPLKDALFNIRWNEADLQYQQQKNTKGKRTLLHVSIGSHRTMNSLLKAKNIAVVDPTARDFINTRNTTVETETTALEECCSLVFDHPEMLREIGVLMEDRDLAVDKNVISDLTEIFQAISQNPRSLISLAQIKKQIAENVIWGLSSLLEQREQDAKNAIRQEAHDAKIKEVQAQKAKDDAIRREKEEKERKDRREARKAANETSQGRGGSVSHEEAKAGQERESTVGSQGRVFSVNTYMRQEGEKEEAPKRESTQGRGSQAKGSSARNSKRKSEKKK